MDNPADYDTDILLWSEKQGQIIRDLASRVKGLPNELDLENVAEEIESVGRSQLPAVKSEVRQLLTHLIKMAASTSDARMQQHWLSEALAFHGNIPDHLTPSMASKIDIRSVWRRAILEAKVAFSKSDDALPDMPKACPFPLDEILNENFDIPAAVETVRFAIGRLISPPA